MARRHHDLGWKRRARASAGVVATGAPNAPQAWGRPEPVREPGLGLMPESGPSYLVNPSLGTLRPAALHAENAVSIAGIISASSCVRSTSKHTPPYPALCRRGDRTREEQTLATVCLVSGVRGPDWHTFLFGPHWWQSCGALACSAPRCRCPRRWRGTLCLAVRPLAAPPPTQHRRRPSPRRRCQRPHQQGQRRMPTSCVNLRPEEQQWSARPPEDWTPAGSTGTSVQYPYMEACTP